MKTFSERLKQARELKNIGSVELGKLLSMGNSTVSRWETGQREPDLETIQKIAKCLSVSVAFLMGETDDPTPYIVKRTFEDIRATAQKNAKDTSSLKNYAANESNGSHIEDVVMVPVVSDKIISACCGNGSPFANDVQWDMEEKPYPVPSSLVSGYTWMGCQFRIMTANGSSMEPYIHTGDKVLFATPYEVGPGDIAVVSINNKLFIKGIKKMDKEQIVFGAFNWQVSPDLPVTLDGNNDVVILGKVLDVVSARKVPQMM